MNFKRAFLILLLIAVIFSITASISIVFQRPPRSVTYPIRYSMPQKRVSLKDANIFVLNIKGILHFSERGPSYFPTSEDAEYYLNLLKKVDQHKNIKALILNINSPGGTIAATQAIYNKINELRKHGVVVVSVINDIGASGAYYVAVASDSIFAQPGSLVGSIGVIVGGINLEKLFEKVGISYNIIKSGKYKDVLAPYRELSEYEKKMLNTLVKDAANQFFDAVKSGRNFSDTQLAQVADAQIFTGNLAKQMGLVDKLGGIDDAIKFAQKKAKILNPRIYYAESPTMSFFTRLFRNELAEYLSLLKSLNHIPVTYLYRF